MKFFHIELENRIRGVSFAILFEKKMILRGRA
jgi:hypothetical protein